MIILNKILLDSVPNYGNILAVLNIYIIKQEIEMSKQKTGSGALVAGGVAAILASTCCLGPLLLVMLGFSGAWIGKLRVMEPYSQYFLALALLAMVFAYRRIYRPVQDCAPGEICAIPQVRVTYKVIFWMVAALILVAIVYPFVVPYFY